jgi:hypothetical protein
MTQIPVTMPEAKYRSTKKQVQPASSFSTSEFVHESQALKPAQVEAVQQKAKAEAKKSSFSAISFWPVAVGIFLSGFAQEWYAMAAQAGIWVMRFTFPLSLLALHHQAGLNGQMVATIPQFAIYAQLPFNGLLIMLVLTRKSLKFAIAQLLLFQAAFAVLLWLLSMNAH